MLLKKGFTNSFALNLTGTIRSLFGHAIASLGDIDKDGFNGDTQFFLKI